MISSVIMIGIGIGIIIIQIPSSITLSTQPLLLGILPVGLAAFTYPLGNRKMMEVYDGRLDTFQRVLCMTIMSMPSWILMTIAPSLKKSPKNDFFFF